MSDFFHLVFAGPEQAAAGFVDDLRAHGFPAEIDRLCAGFEPELLVSFVEALGDGNLGDATYPGDGTVVFTPGSAQDLAQKHGFALRMHGWVTGRSAGDPLLDRLAALEAQIAQLTK